MDNFDFDWYRYQIKLASAAGVARGAKVDDLYPYPLTVFQAPAAYVTFYHPSRQEARRELLIRADNIVSELNNTEPDLLVGDMWKHNLEIILRDLERVRPKVYDVGLMDKYRAWDLVALGVAEYTTAADLDALGDLMPAPTVVSSDPRNGVLLSVKEYEPRDTLLEEARDIIDWG